MEKKRSRVVYPVILTPYQGEYLVYIPDFDMDTVGSSIADAIFMARDEIGIMAMQYEDDHKDIPEPYSHPIDAKKDDIVTLVDIDIEDYKRKHDMRMVKKNCTIPYYMNVEAEKLGVNFSRLLQEALAEKIGCETVS